MDVSQSQSNPLSRATNQSIEALLDRVGLNRLSAEYPRFIEIGRQMRERAVSGEPGPAFSCDNSFLSPSSELTRQPALFLVIDVGGSHTKVAICEWPQAGTPEGRILFDKDNVDFDLSAGNGPAIERFSQALWRDIAGEATRQGLKLSEISGASTIWSNALEYALCDQGGVHGVSGFITSDNLDHSYNKGEVFTAGLREVVKDHQGRYPFGARYFEIARESGINPLVQVVKNDTIGVALAFPGAQAGMVNSTGANATILKDGFFHNGEMGGSVSLEQSFLSNGDSMLALERRERGEKGRVTLEDIMAGQQLGRLFETHIVHLAWLGAQSILPLYQALGRRQPGNTEEALTSKDVDALQMNMLDKSERLQKFQAAGFITEQSLPLLRDLANALAVRGGDAAAGMAYFSLLGQLNDPAGPQRLTLALDSSQARFRPLYLPAMQARLNSLAAAHGKEVRIELLSPTGVNDSFTVPMQGAVYALAGYLARVR